MSTTENIDWENSKENIQPLQQGRKPEILKQALGEHQEEDVQMQRQTYENELRTYSGKDPLSVWCKYIKWVEQYFPKGGRDGHYEQLVRKCVSILKDEQKYYDDMRFINIWLKFANLTIKPIDVYNYMYSHKIGCNSAAFFSAWAWELEQQGNIKKANDVLQEGINRKAEPMEHLKAFRTEFEIRISKQIMKLEQDSDCHRSAFTLLKPQRNAVPVTRTGEFTVEPNKASLIIGRQQPAPRHGGNISSSKMPFKIHNKDTFLPPLPVQPSSGVPFVFHSDSSKENEIKPSKWNKVKVKQKIPVIQASSEIGFSFHCDENPQPICTPRSIPKVSDILHLRKNCKSPAMALFEPPDPKKMPMYDKNKVYGGAEEFSLEEIRAAAWLKQNYVINNEKNSTESKRKALVLDSSSSEKEISFKIHADKDNQSDSQNTAQRGTGFFKPSFGQKQENIPRALFSPLNPKKRPIYDRNQIYSGKEELSFEEIKAKEWMNSEKELLDKQKELEQLQKQVQFLTQQVNFLESQVPNQKCVELSEKQSDIQVNSFPDKLSLFQTQKQNSEDLSIDKKQTSNEQIEIKLPSVSQSEYLQSSQLTNTQEQKDITNKVTDNVSIENYQVGTTNVTENLSGKCLNSTSYSEVADIMQQFYNGTLAIPKAIFENELLQNMYNDSFKCINNADLSNKKEYSYEKVLKVELPFAVYQDSTESKINDLQIPTRTNSELPFTVYQDSTESKINDLQIPAHKNSELPFNVYHDPTDIITQPNIKDEIKAGISGFDQIEINDEMENIPPKDYRQDTTKRELSGILTLSKNVMFVPLELQKQDEDEEMGSDSEDIYIDSNHAEMPNETLIPPCNTEQFVSAPFLSSTPCTAAKISKRQNLPLSNRDDKQEPCNIDKEDCKMGPPPVNAESISNKQCNGQRLDKIVYPVRPSSLSVIMETSKESYKSSASSGSSASVTKLSQFEHCYSYDKSNVTNKEVPKANTFKEPKLMSIEPNLEVKKELQPDISLSFVPIDSIDDPFADKFTEKLLQSLSQPPHHHTVLDICNKSFKNLRVSEKVKISEYTYLLADLIAEGAYGKVFLGEKEDSFTDTVSSKFAVKVCKHANEWELYICSTLHKRLKEVRNVLNIDSSVMDIIAAKKWGGNMILVTEYCRYGTLLDMVNFYKQRNSTAENLTMYCTLELLQIVSQMHKCKIVHADIKPDNIMLWDLPADENLSGYLDQKTCFLRVIDFGRSLDLNFFREGISFKYPLQNRCMEALEDKSWVFQPDWLGVLDCVHTLLFGEYMKVKREENDRWGIEKKFRRYWSGEIWSPLFDELLNLPSGCKEPNVSEHVNRIKTKLQKNISSLKNEFVNLQNNYMRK